MSKSIIAYQESKKTSLLQKVYGLRAIAPIMIHSESGCLLLGNQASRVYTRDKVIAKWIIKAK